MSAVQAVFVMHVLSCNICNINYKVIIVLSDFKPWFLSRAFYLLFFYFQHIRNMERGVFLEEKYMGRAIELARNGTGRVNPNPLVGAVIVKDGEVIAEGYHEEYGGLHAERNAFKNLKGSAEGADIYVTLEPCCHYGKQPPCTQAIIENGIKNVYIGSDDPNSLVAGNGIKQLRDAGINVVTGVLKEECDALNLVFFHYITTKTPYVVMKYAMTLDGKTACDSGESKWVTGEEARAYVQKTRNALTGIMAGVQTVINDNPELTCHMPSGRNPVRIICDSHLRIPDNCKILETAQKTRTIIATVSEDEKRIKQLEDRGAVIVKTAALNGRTDLKMLMGVLGSMGIDGLLLEGGGTLNNSALKAGIVNHVQAYIAPKIFGGSGKYTPVGGESVLSPDGAYICENMDIKKFGSDILLEYDIKPGNSM